MGNSKKSVFKSALDFDARQLAVCLEIITEQKALLAIVRKALPTEIGEHVQHCVSSGNRLLIYTEAASWASQIRFYHASILNKIAESGQKNIISLQVRIGPQLSQQTSPKTARLPSAENIEMIRNQFKDDENGDVLKRALARLAGTLEKRLKNTA
ncbi:MAG: DciA family protein [Methylococcaceae bacterium]|nr:DciA family protein [Methylococcaceae bacterium]